MASKPLDQLSPAYRKRIARAIAQGKTRQQARGHKAKEHVERREREIASGMLTSSQRQQVAKVAREVSKRMHGPAADPAQTIQQMQAWATRQGYDQFKQLRDFQNQAKRDLEDAKRQRRSEPRRRGVRRPKVTVRDPGEMFDLADELDVPDERWLWYH